MRTKGSGAHCARKVSVHALMVTVAASSLMMGATQVAAQDAAVAEEDVEVVVVRGVRASAAKAVDVKRRSTQIVDSVIAEDIGKLPDNNVVEALQRVPGIQVTGRLGGEVSGITIRGLPDIATTWNGRTVFTTTGRQQALQDIPANLVNRIDVYKTRTAKQIEHGIAGQVDVSTHRPFNFRGAQVTAAARGTWNEQADKYNPNLSALVSNRWDTSMGEVGALLNVSFNRTQYRDQNILAGAMVPFATETPPAGFVPFERFFPDQPRSRWPTGLEHGLPYTPGSTLPINTDTVAEDAEYYLSRDAAIATDLTGDRKRSAVNTAFQWRPNDRSEYTLEYVYEGYRNDRNVSMLFTFVDWWGALGANPTYELIPDTNIIKSRAVNSVFGFNSADFVRQGTDTHILALNGKWNLTDRLTLVGDLTYQKSEFETEFIAARTERGGHNAVVDFNYDDGLPAWTLTDPNNPDLLTDPDAWAVAQMYDTSDRHKGDALTATLDGNWEANEGILKRVSFGIRYDDRGATQWHRDQEANGILRRQLSSFDPASYHVNSGFFDGRSDVPRSWILFDGKWLYDNADFMRETYRDHTFVEDVNGVPTTRQPFAHIRTSDQLEFNRDFDIQETTTSAYFQADLEPYIFDRPLLVNFGLRYVRVETDMSFTERFGQRLTSDASIETRQILPSLTLRYDLTDKVRLRYNYGETLRRPNFGDLNPNFSLTGDLSGIGRGSGSRGNPDLKATQSKNTDIGVEWYFAPDSVVSLTAFKREIEGLVVSGVAVQNIPGTGLNTDTFVIAQPLNASDGNLEGVELGLTYFPDYLPGVLDGLGIQASATWLDSSQNIPIYDSSTGQIIGEDNVAFFGVSDFSYNATLAYERGPIGARLSYVWRDHFQSANEARLFANPLGIWVRPEASLDLQLNYDISDKLSLSLDAVNLTDELSQSYYKFGSSGGPQTHNFNNIIMGRSVSLGLRWRLN